MKRAKPCTVSRADFRSRSTWPMPEHWSPSKPTSCRIDARPARSVSLVNLTLKDPVVHGLRGSWLRCVQACIIAYYVPSERSACYLDCRPTQAEHGPMVITRPRLYSSQCGRAFRLPNGRAHRGVKWDSTDTVKTRAAAYRSQLRQGGNSYRQAVHQCHIFAGLPSAQPWLLQMPWNVARWGYVRVSA